LRVVYDPFRRRRSSARHSCLVLTHISDDPKMSNSRGNRALTGTARHPAGALSSAGTTADLRKPRISRKTTHLSAKDVGKDKAFMPGDPARQASIPHKCACQPRSRGSRPAGRKSQELRSAADREEPGKQPLRGPHHPARPASGCPGRADYRLRRERP
jgi:hypothetical protein